MLYMKHKQLCLHLGPSSRITMPCRNLKLQVAKALLLSNKNILHKGYPIGSRTRCFINFHRLPLKTRK